MKKLIIILITLACILTVGAGQANASGSGLYTANTVTPVISPLSGNPGSFKVVFVGMLVTFVFDGYTFPLPSDWNGDQQQMSTNACDNDGCRFEIIAETNSGPLAGAGSTTSFGVNANGFFCRPLGTPYTKRCHGRSDFQGEIYRSLLGNPERYS